MHRPVTADGDEVQATLVERGARRRGRAARPARLHDVVVEVPCVERGPQLGERRRDVAAARERVDDEAEPAEHVRHGMASRRR